MGLKVVRLNNLPEAIRHFSKIQEDFRHGVRIVSKEYNGGKHWSGWRCMHLQGVPLRSILLLLQLPPPGPHLLEMCRVSSSVSVYLGQSAKIGLLAAIPNPQPATLNSELSTLKPQTSNLKPQPFDSRPSTLNPQPSTLNPQPPDPTTLKHQPSTQKP